MKHFDPTLYFITDSQNIIGDETLEGLDVFLEIAEKAILGGASIIQLREKSRSTRDLLEIAKALHKVTCRYSVPLIIDDRLDIAMAAECEGVHLGASDMPVDAARRILGESFIIGATAKTVPWALDVFEKGADYLGVGAIYPTTTKVKTVITSVDVLSEIRKAVPVPVCAIGGLNAGNLGVLRGTDIHGICAVSAIMKAENPQKAAKELKESFLAVMKK